MATLRDLTLRDLGEVAQLVSGRPAMYWGAEVQNLSGRMAYVQVFDAASLADVTVGVTAPTIESCVRPQWGSRPWNYRQSTATRFQRGIVIAASLVTGVSQSAATAVRGAALQRPSGVHVHAFFEASDGG